MKLRKRLLLLAMIFVFALTGFSLAYRSIVKKPEVPMPPVAAAPVEDDTKGDETPIEFSGDRREDYFTFLICGRDVAGSNTDTIMFVSCDVKNKSVSVMSIPRDTMVNVSWDIKRINSVYAYLGLEGLQNHVEKLIGIRPDYYILVNLNGFEKLVDAIGGVEFDVPRRMKYSDPLQGLQIDLQKGFQKLNGSQAMQLVRYRSYLRGDLDRVKVQQDLVAAIAKKCLNIASITKIGEFAKIFSQHVESNLTVGNLVWFGQQMMSMRSEHLFFETMPNKNVSHYSTSYASMQSYVTPERAGILELVNGHFNPFYKKITANDLDLMSMNSDGSLSASGGVLADPRASQPAPPPEPKPEPEQGLEVIEDPKKDGVVEGQGAPELGTEVLDAGGLADFADIPDELLEFPEEFFPEAEQETVEAGGQVPEILPIIPDEVPPPVSLPSLPQIETEYEPVGVLPPMPAIQQKAALSAS